MDDIRQQFQSSSIEFLKQSLTELADREIISEDFIHKLFRRVHTIKGSSQVFGLTAASRLAHAVEEILDTLRKDITASAAQKDFLTDGLKFLKLTLEYPDFVVPQSFFDKLGKPAPQPVSADSDIFLTLIPPEIFDQLTDFEKLKLQTVNAKNKNLICIEAVFKISDFSERLRELQSRLGEKGEIIFTLPSAKTVAADEIGFEIFVSTDESLEIFNRIAENFGIKLSVLTTSASFGNDLKGIFLQMVSQGKVWANELGKQVEFQVLSDEPPLNAKYLNLIFEILLHLIRNAVDHAFDASGHIEIQLKEIDGGINLTLTDDGKGIDPFVVRAKAVEQKLILADTNLSEQETLDLIFLPGFSTAKKLTEISGRGVGLDEVQNLVVNAKGTISVESTINKGTVFEIFLPLKS